MFAPARQDPRFAQLVAQLGHAEQYRTSQESIARAKSAAAAKK
jgi:hypothetical protein